MDPSSLSLKNPDFHPDFNKAKMKVNVPDRPLVKCKKQ